MSHSETAFRDDHVEPTSADRLVRFMLWVFIGAIFFSIGGILLIKIAPGVLRYFGEHFPTLVKAPTWTYMTLLPVIAAGMYYDRIGWRRLALLVVIGSVIGAGAELLGTTTGFPFGAYSYTDWLGPKIFGHVPFFIPLSWFAMGLVCYDLARRLSDRTAITIVLGATFMVGWDVSLDPAMSRAFPFWTYGEDGFFYGMPISNWVGWFATSALIMASFHVIARKRDVFSHRAPFFFFLNCAFPFMLSLQYGLYGAVAAGIATTAVILWVVKSRGRRPGSPGGQSLE